MVGDSDIAIDAVQIREGSSETDIVTFAFAEQTGPATIDAANHTIAIEVLGGTATSLVPTFTLSEGATATVSDIAQTSGTTANDFTNAVTYTLTAEDGTTQEWVVTVTEAACLSAFPYLEGFETDLGVWTQNIDDTTDWRRYSFSTPDGTTGPSAASEGTFYTYIEASNNYRKTAILTSSCFDIVSLTNPVLNFKYHMYGGDMGSLEVEIATDSDSSWRSVWSKSGNQRNVWSDVSIDLSSYASENPRFRFKGVVGGGWDSDIAIDAVQIREGSSETDIVTFAFAEQTGPATIDAANHTIAIEVLGGAATSLVPTFTLSEGATATVSDIAQTSGTTANDFTNAVTYTLTAEDGTTQEWVVTVTEAACLSAFPYLEGFETDLGVWTQNIDDTTDWRRYSFSTPDGTTGPSAASEGTFYTYIEADNNYRKTAILTSSCFDIVSLTNPVLNFKYHMYGGDMGSLEVEIATDSDSSWRSVWSKSGNQRNVWSDVSIDLSSYASENPRFRFKGIVGGGWGSDIAIDAVQIREGNSETDIVTFAFAEQTGPATIDAANHTIAIEVLGGAATSLVPTFTLSEGATATVSDIAQTSGTTANDFTNAVTYTLTAEDGTTQEWVVTVTEAACLSAFPYLEGFETDLGVWTQNIDDTTDWRRYSFSTPTGTTGPSAASEGTFYTYIEASNNYRKTAILTSSCFDIVSLTNPVLNFKYHMYGGDMGSLEVEIATDSDSSWRSVWSKSGNQRNVWSDVSIDLSSYASENPRFRFKGIVGGGWDSDIAIDAVQIREGNSETDIVTSTKKIMSTRDIVFSESLLIYPNPAPNKIYIATAHRLDTVKIYGINGKLLQELTPQKIEDTYEIAIANFSPGIYFIEMMSGNKKAVKRFVKK